MNDLELDAKKAELTVCIRGYKENYIDYIQPLITFLAREEYSKLIHICRKIIDNTDRLQKCEEELKNIGG